MWADVVGGGLAARLARRCIPVGGFETKAGRGPRPFFAVFLSEPIVRAVDALVGSVNAMRVDVTRSDGGGRSGAKAAVATYRVSHPDLEVVSCTVVSSGGGKGAACRITIGRRVATAQSLTLAPSPPRTLRTSLVEDAVGIERRRVIS